MKIFLDENFGITNINYEETTQDSVGYNIIKCYVPSDLVSEYDSFGVYYAAVLPNSRKVGYFALEGQLSSDEANYTLYKASLHTSVVSVAGVVQLGFRFLYGDTGDASLTQKTTPVIQFPIRKSVSVNNDILILDSDQDSTDVLQSYKNLLETALATYVTIASLGTSVTTATLNATNATITSGTVTTLDSDTATIDNLVVNNSVSMGRLSGTTVGSKSTTLGTNNTASATNAYAEGYQTQASGLNSHAEGNQTKATNLHSHAEGSGTKATGNTSHAEGAYTEANGGTSHAEGYYSVANVDSAHAEGIHTTSGGIGGHAEGYYTTVSGNHSHAEGNNTTASGSDSHSEGYYSVASGTNAHSEGSNTTASGNDSHAEGNSTQAVGNISHAEGSHTIANGVAQHVGGKYNVADTTSLEIIGNGTADNARSNARKLDVNGNETLAGDLIYNKSTSLTNKISSLENADTTLQTQINTLKSVQNVVDTVATYSALTSLATTNLDANDKVQVIADETHNGASTIYNWNGSAWQYVGAYGGNSYTKTETDTLLNAKASKNGSASEDFATDDLTVSGTATITGNTTIGGTASVTGNATFSGNTTISGTTNVGGDIIPYSDSTRNLGSSSKKFANVYADNITKLEREIENLKQASLGNIMQEATYSGTAYEYSLDSNTMPNGYLLKIGGMSYKTTNVLNLTDTSGSRNGVTYTVSDGVITLNGTASAGSFNQVLTLTTSIPKGTYTFLPFGTYTNVSMYIIDNGVTYETNVGSSTSVTITTDSATVNLYFKSAASGYTYSNYNIKPMLVSGSTAPSEFKPYFEGIRDTAVTSVVSKGANLLQLIADTSGTVAGVRYNISNGVVTLNGKSTSTEGFWISLNTTVTAGEYYFKIFNPINQGNSTFIRLDNAGTSAVALVRGTSTGTSLTLSEGEFKAFFWIGSSGITFNNLVIYPMLVKGSTAPTEFKPYIQPITKQIPSQIQALDGYGWGVNDTCYNYIDYETKKFVQKVGRVDLEKISVSNIVKYDVTAGTLFRVFITGVKITNSTFVASNAICIGYTTTTLENRANMTLSQSIGNSALDFINNSYSTAEEFKTAMSGVYLYYELATPVETDISSYLDDDSDLLTDLEGNGTLVFNNTYEQEAVYEIFTYEKI